MAAEPGRGKPYGDTTGTLTNDAKGDFGPPWSGPLPTSGLDALVVPGAATDLSTTNLANYALTGAAAVFTNNAGASFTVQSSGEPCPWDCQDMPNGDVDVADFLEFLANFGSCP